MDPLTGTAKRYYYDDQRIALQTSVSGVTETDEKYFIFGNYIDEVLLMHNLAGTNTGDYYYGHDHLYSPTVLFESDGDVVERYEYDVYGACRILSDSYQLRANSLYGNPYTFTGRELDMLDLDENDVPRLKLMYYRARSYDPQTGRFLQRDPLRYVDGMNLYEYVKSNSLYNLDPDGRMVSPVIGGVIIATAACVAPHAFWWHIIAEQYNDKYAHCVVSCRISKSCGRLLAMASGYGKELRDEIAKQLGQDDPGWDPEDNAANAAGRSCAGWVSWVPGPISWTVQCFRKTCEECCAESGYVNE